MTRLIKNELIKIFHKKAIYIIGILIFAFCLLSNILIKTKYDEQGNLKRDIYGSDAENEYIKEELNKLNVNSRDDVELYVNYKTEYDLAVLKKQYEYGSWQYNVISDRLYGIIHSINFYTYNLKDSDLVNENTAKYNLYLTKFENNDWQYFVLEDIKLINNSISILKKTLTKTTNKQEISYYNKQIGQLEEQKVLLNYRIEKNISYENGYLSDALKSYSNYLSAVKMYEEKNNLTDSEEQEYNIALINLEINKYIIESGNNIHKPNTLRGIIIHLIDDYQLFVIALVLIIAGSIVSEEYHKGTIKILLVKPYKRSTILLSKYLTLFIIILLTILFTLILELIVGGIIFGFDSLSIPMMVYNYNSMSLVSYNAITYFVIIALSKLPMYILIMTLAFSLSTIFGNSVVASMITILGFLLADIINQMILYFNITWLKYFVTPNWNFTEYLFGGSPTFSNINLNFSIIICLIYYLVMIITMFIVFQKKNIKNQ